MFTDHHSKTIEPLETLLDSVSAKAPCSESGDRSPAAELADELAFKKRFGFSLNTTQRRSLLALKARYDLTDDQIRFLKRTDSLKITATRVEMNASRFTAMVALFSISCTTFALIMTLACMAIGVLTIDNVFLLAAFILCFFVAATFFRWAFIKPWWLQKQVLSARSSLQSSVLHLSKK